MFWVIHLYGPVRWVAIIYPLLRIQCKTGSCDHCKTTARVCWAISALLGVAAMFSVTVFYQPGHQYDALEAAVYASLHRLAWCLATCWLIFACVTGHGGVMQRALTWRPLVPLSRLTYCAYLVNGVVVLHSVAGVRQPRFLSTPTLAMEVISQVAATFFGALLLSLMFESPIHGLERILLRKVRGSDRKDANGKATQVEGQPSPEEQSQL